VQRAVKNPIAKKLNLNRQQILDDIQESVAIQNKGQSTDAYYKSKDPKNWEKRKNFINSVLGLQTKKQLTINPLIGKVSPDLESGIFRTFAFDRLQSAIQTNSNVSIPFGANSYYAIRDNLLPQSPRFNRNGELVKETSKLQTGLMADSKTPVTFQKTSMPKKLDADYMKAVNNGNMDTAQRMVDEAAKRMIEAMPVSDNNKEIPNLGSISADGGSYKEMGIREVPTSIFSGKGKKAFYDPREDKRVDRLMESMREEGVKAPLIVVVDGHPDGVAYVMEGAHRLAAIEELKLPSFPALVLYDESANPITRDDSGQVIPLSQRFKATSEDIRYLPKGKSKATKPESETVRISNKKYNNPALARSISSAISGASTNKEK
jgi:hypothetical protein